MKIEGTETGRIPAPFKSRRKSLTRDELKDRLQRIDGGGKHYGSKRFHSNHRGSGHGKRSGRS